MRALALIGDILKATMAQLVKEIVDLTALFKQLKSSLNLDKKSYRLHKLEADSTDADLWKDPNRAKAVMQEISDLKKEQDEIKDIDDRLNALSQLAKEEELASDIAKEIQVLEKKLATLKISILLSGEYDKKNAIISIHAGQGGVEAMDWASMLYRMYLRFSEKRNWGTRVLDVSEGEEAGIKSVTFEVEGSFAYGYLKGEAGTHRLVRQSPFNADKLRQTSFALVEVLPELEETDLPNIKIKNEDLEWQFFRASSKGGQNVQKVSTAVRVRHKPTEIVVTAQAERFQEQNRKNALNLLRAKLWAREQAMKEKKVESLRGEYRPASWGNQIRSYVLHPYKMVKDLRTEFETSNTDSVLDGGLDEFIEAELKINKD